METVHLPRLSVSSAKQNLDHPIGIEPQAWAKALFFFLGSFLLYWIFGSPGLDEIDSVNFAMGVRHFDVWQHQPHPPGYPLYIFLGWLGSIIFGASPDASLHFVAAVGGGMLVATWFITLRLQFNERLAWWLSVCPALTPVVWMTATKVLTDSLAAGLLSAQILAAVCFNKNGRKSSLLATALLGAAAAGARRLLRGFLQLRAPWNRAASAVPAVLLLTTVPVVLANYHDPAPPVRFVRYLQQLCPPAERGRVVLLLSTRTKRHAEWYSPDFVIINPIPPPEKLAEITKGVVAVHTDDPVIDLPPHWYRVPLNAFTRSVIIYWKVHYLELYLVARPNGR